VGSARSHYRPGSASCHRWRVVAGLSANSVESPRPAGRCAALGYGVFSRRREPTPNSCQQGHGEQQPGARPSERALEPPGAELRSEGMRGCRCSRRSPPRDHHPYRGLREPVQALGRHLGFEENYRREPIRVCGTGRR
jgi:hypothetical protein